MKTFQKRLLAGLCLVLLAACQSGESQNDKPATPVSLAKTEWYLPNGTEFYNFLNDTQYNYCHFNPGIVQDEGTYTFQDGLVTFHSSRTGKTRTARVLGEKLTVQTGEVYTRQ